ncbi:MAG: methionine--tRNA ligase [Candidatus Portnoybacteria bacterium CG10_big_fil_rev_8_21_14_0_10_44_7]|uniref:Methionine--tRNA ligase n=1 Tax=Candidatus Portnoybacteria bacterium CG10_big_fil_rev_8_21_14_0_10_44_7 TaxID=1974816 RepID=A0A2M8KJ45_9BACT|nr:MAG: methionine--tRNA ligase [Candidatus Portnoybacteria bacterium CG10_big_fil_rev_8_21_14_0_10_44_7]
MKKFYITTPIYYVNGSPHIGHAYTTVAADVLARYQKSLGREVFFSVGTDEHGLKIQQKAEQAGKKPQEFTDEIAGQFKDLWQKLNIDYSAFSRTTNPKHKQAVQNVLQRLYDQGAIYKGTYEGLYCVGCEQFLNEKDLVAGKCPDHGQEPEAVKEEAYLLKLKDVADKLIKKIESQEFHITPQRYANEILSLLKGEGLRDVSISRKNVSWGIPLPFDSSHTTYVWVDAFLNYLTVLDWDLLAGSGRMQNFWPPDIQLIGKDILRVHATIWPAILLHLNLPLPKKLVVHGHILSGNRKMSKTLGNVISVEDLMAKFGAEATRYLLLSAGTFGEDINVTTERLTEKYNADLANGLGNLVARVIKLNENIKARPNKNNSDCISCPTKEKLFADFQLNEVLAKIWGRIEKANLAVEQKKLWELIKQDENKATDILTELLMAIWQIAQLLSPFMPKTSEKIKEILKNNKSQILFPRVEKPN